MALQLDTHIQYLKGVGPKLGALLKSRGISTVLDLLEHYPRNYEDQRQARNISSLQPGDIVGLVATVVQVQSYNMGRSRRKIYDVTLSDETGKICCKYFRVPYKGYFERFRPGLKVKVVGKVTDYRGRIEFHHPDIKDYEKEEEGGDQLIPIYVEIDGIQSSKLRRLITAALQQVQDEIPETLPPWILKDYNLPSRKEALLSIHQPPKGAGREYLERKSMCHQRIIFEEFFWFELFLASRKSGVRNEQAPEIHSGLKLAEALKKSLPFCLTGAQERVFKEIIGDLAKSYPMHRLVQGDVGSGKTMVAFLAAVSVAEAGLQSSLMVPTEILAEQHYKNAQKILEPLGLHVELLTGKTKAKERREILASLKNGEIDICVGTHALIQEDVEFHDLGLVIIDEQHRFGVHQRGVLKQKGRSPHFLVMTATPIPRTLAMTVYGDLEVSVIDEMPKGRIPIQTRVAYESKRRQMLQFLAEQIGKGRQAYIVYPLVEESEKIDLKDALSQFEKLKEEFPQIKFGLLHGKMKSAEKEEVMGQFRRHEIQVLVSTTVIEVGVDVPNANMMVVEHAERFGLSQLHQLRGRVGRGEHKSFCILMLGRSVSQESYDRTQIMEKTADGFQIAEADLEIRGPGEFLGTRQSGLAGFRMANLVRDLHILQKAREAAFSVVSKDPQFSREEHQGLKEELEKTHGPIALASIG